MSGLPSTLRKRLRNLTVSGVVEIHERVDLREWNRLRVGGPADVMVRCGTAQAVSTVVDHFASHGLRWLVVGSGSRLVPPDSGLRVPVIGLTGELTRWEVDLDGVVAGAGAKMAQIRVAVARAGLPAAGIPAGVGGSVGGAVRRRASGENNQLRDRIEWFDLVKPGLGVERVFQNRGQQRPAMPCDCRSVIVGARISIDHRRPYPGVSEADGGTVERRRGRPSARLFAGFEDGMVDRLVAKAGCSGMVVGAFQLSEDAPNRVRASRMASSGDLLELTRVVSRRVFDDSGERLVPALCFVDEDGRRIVR